MQGRGGQGVQLWKLTEDSGQHSRFCGGRRKRCGGCLFRKGKRIRLDMKALAKVTRANKGYDLGRQYVKGALFGDDEGTGGVVIC